MNTVSDCCGSAATGIDIAKGRCPACRKFCAFVVWASSGGIMRNPPPPPAPKPLPVLGEAETMPDLNYSERCDQIAEDLQRNYEAQFGGAGVKR